MVVTQIASDLGYRVHSFLFLYLGVPLGGRMLDCSGWNPMVDMFRNRLSHWKCHNLFMGDRLTLIKFVLCSIPIYSLSVYVLPMSVRNN